MGKEEIACKAISPFSHDVFYPLGELPAILIKLKIHDFVRVVETFDCVVNCKRIFISCHSSLVN